MGCGLVGHEGPRGCGETEGKPLRFKGRELPLRRDVAKSRRGVPDFFAACATESRRWAVERIENRVERPGHEADSRNPNMNGDAE